MQRSTARRRIGNKAPLAAIELRQSAQSEQRSRAALLLTIFLRLVALLCLAEGLAQWTSVLMSNAEGRSPLALLSTDAAAAVVFFALIDPIAAVGLWLGTPWGCAIWLCSVAAQLLVIATVPEVFRHAILMGLVSLALVAIYAMLAWQRARAESRRLDTP